MKSDPPSPVIGTRGADGSRSVSHVLTTGCDDSELATIGTQGIDDGL